MEMIDLKPGDRIELVQMVDDPYPINPGEKGTVTLIVPFLDFTQVKVKWDNGRGLMLSVPPDQYRKLEK